MAQTMRIKTAGGLTKISVSPRVKRSDGFQTRKEKSRLTSKSQKYINNKAMHSNLEFLLAANIRPGDLWLTFTYQNDQLPRDWAEANKRMQALCRKLREHSRDRPIYFYNIERAHYSEDETQCHRWHHHMVLHCDLDPDEIRQLWGRGNVDIHPITIDRDHTYDSMATYLIKEANEFPGKRAWRSSRNLAKPDTDTVTVPDDYQLPVPDRSDTCLILENSGQYITEYGKYQHLKFQTLDGYETGSVAYPASNRKRKRAAAHGAD